MLVVILVHLVGLEVSGSGDEGGEGDTEDIAVSLDQFTKYSTLKEVSALNYSDDSDQPSACSIVSSIEFDKDGEMFAVGGATKKIKVSLYICDRLTLAIITTVFRSTIFHTYCKALVSPITFLHVR